MGRQANYGIDSPAIVTGQLVLGLVALGCMLFPPHLFGLSPRWPAAIASAYFLFGAAGML